MRFVDNFSAGTRGAASAEYFFEHDYSVIFLHRQKSLEPFVRHFNGQRFFDMLEINERGPSTTISGDNQHYSYFKSYYSSMCVVHYISNLKQLSNLGFMF